MFGLRLDYSYAMTGFGQPKRAAHPDYAAADDCDLAQIILPLSGWDTYRIPYINSNAGSAE
ncbi:MAG TPA: hypothetical protein VF776_03815 [Sphingomicrobium sp.]